VAERRSGSVFGLSIAVTNLSFISPSAPSPRGLTGGEGGVSERAQFSMADRYKQKSHSDRGSADNRGTSRVDDSGGALAVSSHTRPLSDVVRMFPFLGIIFTPYELGVALLSVGTRDLAEDEQVGVPGTNTGKCTVRIGMGIENCSFVLHLP
jgi:hypothetical protein